MRLSLIHILNHPERIGNNVVVIDRNGHIKAPGVCEYALSLGARVHYVTPASAMGVDLDGMTLQHLNLRLFGNELFSYDVYSDLEEIGEHSVVIGNVFGSRKKEIDGIDTLILVNQPMSENVLYKELKANRKNVFALGDCNAPRLIEQAIYESEKLGREIETKLQTE